MTRMWMVNPKYMCRQHLLGEHNQLHKAAGNILKGRSIQGYIDRGFLFPMLMQLRHLQLAHEMMHRDYQHSSPFYAHVQAQIQQMLPAEGYYSTGENILANNWKILCARCPECRIRKAFLTGQVKLVDYTCAWCHPFAPWLRQLHPNHGICDFHLNQERQKIGVLSCEP